MYQQPAVPISLGRKAPVPVYDSYAPKDGRLSDAFAEAQRALGVFETLRSVAAFRALDFACGDLKVTLHLTPSNAAYFAHLDRYQAFDQKRRGYKQQYGF